MTTTSARQPDQRSDPEEDGLRDAPVDSAPVADPQAVTDELPRRLDAILRALPESEFLSLVKRMGIRIDKAKRIDAPSQAARALVSLPDVRDLTRLPPASRELLHRIAEAGGLIQVPTLPAGLEPLFSRGVVYARKAEGGIELVLPTAFLIQIRSWESEDPRSLRALLAQAPFETLSAIATQYLGRPATPPIMLSLELAWETVNDSARLKEEVERLAPVERRLLEAVESVGGEVDTQELLDLEREPMRLRGVTGVTSSRRGAGFALERRAFLIPIHPNRHVVPTEVAVLVGAERRRMRETRREQIRSFVIAEDHAPRRARFAPDPGMLALALAYCIREPGSEIRSGVGTPRSLLVRLAQRIGRDVESIALLAALSRAIGLWEASAASSATPPGSLSAHELTPLLFNTWRRGGAWDEARAERELLRAASDNRDASPIRALREMVLDALHDLGEGRWVPWQSLKSYLAADERIAGVERLLRRWAERAGVDEPQVLEVTRRIALESLPALGILDLGGVNDAADAGVPLRLTPRGRALLAGSAPNFDTMPSKFIDTHALRVNPTAKIAPVLGLTAFAELGRVDDHVDLIFSSASIARALSVGYDSDALKARIEAVASLPDTISRMLAQASVVIGKASLVPVSGFVWIEDPEVRELLRTRRPTAELFIDPSPPAGLLVDPSVDLERLIRRCRALGVEVELDATQIKASRATPASGTEGPHRVPSSPAMRRKSSVPPRSR